MDPRASVAVGVYNIGAQEPEAVQSAQKQPVFKRKVLQDLTQFANSGVNVVFVQELSPLIKLDLPPGWARR